MEVICLYVCVCASACVCNVCDACVAKYNPADVVVVSFNAGYLRA